ncbi:lipopolysaccharide biosynthesis protein RfbH [uncultured Methanospirillum sp.]|uniref:lipopolysaccharide biosynthesis protein RfbH n=1 Tax=uncultured Methanospirillum sp. TaxID=262503 RepID=UPI0029C96A68|nr:lipopolysaccharide biosynthesis protein RfbH [uncultured Methanospirillum sp.]
MVQTEEIARAEILQKVADYYNNYHNQEKKFEIGNRIPYAARIFDEKELCNLVDSALDFWLTAGKYCDKFETQFSEYLNVKNCYLVNSGSSANLLAFMALTSPILGERKISPGDEVITIAAGFPTTVTPIIQYGAIPVFVDVTFPQYNIDPNQVLEAISEKTKAIMVAHTLGNPFELDKIIAICKKHNLWLIEDNCDALGSQYFLNGEWGYTGTFGDIGTSSFYPPHHITMGEGGAVYTNNPVLGKIVRSLRDWGRDCSCPSGVDNRCGHRFDRQYGGLPIGYDHKYVYSHFGYNLKATEMQAAIGCEQLQKLPHFIERRVQNWNRIYNGLNDLSEAIILPEPTKNSNPSWFGFLITIKNIKKIDRTTFVKYLEENGIQTRMLFAGNLLKHPCFDQMNQTGKGFRVYNDLPNTEKILSNSFWIGVYPGIDDNMIDYMIERIRSFIIS